MIVEHFDRGNSFEWTASFTDVNGDIADPDSVTLYVSFINSAGERETAEIDMAGDTDGVWTGTWDSSVSKQCQINWSVRAVNPTAAKDGKFYLDANLANPGPDVSV